MLNRQELAWVKERKLRKQRIKSLCDNTLGWKPQQMLAGIEGVLNLAAAAGEDLGTTSDIVTDALTALGLTAEDTGRFVDVLAAASTNSNTNVSLMGETFKYVAPLAGSMHYSMEDLALAIGLMANAGIKGSSSGTALRNIITNMAKPTTAVQSAMDRLGVSLDDGAGNMYSLRQIMDQLRSSFKDVKFDTDTYNKVVDQLDKQLADGTITEEEYTERVENAASACLTAADAQKAELAASLAGKYGLSGLLSIVSATEEDYNKLADAIDNSSGSAKNMADIMQDNLNGQITILKSALQELMIQIGDALMPVIRNIVSHIQSFVEKLQKMDEGTRNTIIRIAAFAAAIGPLLLVIGKLTTGVGQGMQAISSMGKSILTFVNEAKMGVGAGGKLAAAIGGISAPVAAVIAAVAVLTAAFVTLWNSNEDFRNSIIAIWEGITKKLSEAFQKITDAINKLGFHFKDITEVLSAVWNAFCNALAPIFEGVFKALGETIEGIIDVVTGVIEVITGLIIGFRDGDWSTFGQGLLDIINGVVNAIWGVIQGLFKLFGIELEDFDGDWGKIWEGMKSVFVAVFEAIKNFFVTIWNGITGFFKGVGIRNK